ncbi:hypothetical protein AB0D08_27645 [Kitasatospora sp. NPDC048540]|uniref:hypothetical protein n=1 Tax=Kitasatospora sp. NPDC048540 TaxID=3155634 RepID=UPI0033F52740
MEFLLGVAASLVAAILLAFSARYLPGRLKAVVAALVGRALGCGIDRVFENEDAASGDILSMAATSKAIRVLSIRGFRLTGEGRPLNKLLDKSREYDSLEVMLADPKSSAVVDRAAGFEQQSAIYPMAAMYVEDVARSLAVLAEHARHDPRIRVRMHSQCQSFRLFITDDYIYLSFFPKGRSASTSPVYRVRKASLLYEALLRHYLWVRDELSEEYLPQPRRE